MTVSIVLTFSIILSISFILALISMKDLEVPHEVRRVIAAKKIRGTIIFSKQKIRHYRA